MRKVINGMWFDTDTAKYICTEPGDRYHHAVDLYVTKKGNYFLASDPASYMELISKDQARRILESHEESEYYLSQAGFTVEEG